MFAGGSVVVMKLSRAWILSLAIGMVFCLRATGEEYASGLVVLGQNKITNGILSDTVPVSFKVGKYPGILKSVALHIDGRIFRGDDASLGTPLPRPARFQMDTCFLENGRHTLQIEGSWLNPNPNNPNFIYDVRRSAPIFITVSNEIYYPDWESEIGEAGISAYFFKTSHTNVDWHIDIYDSRGKFVQRLSGHTMDGKIEAYWHMKDAKGVLRTNADKDPEFSSVVTVEDQTNKWTKVQK